MLDFKQLLLLSLKYWWVYAISVFFCLLVAGAVYLTKPATFRVDAALMLRQLEDDKSNQGEMLKMMGGGSDKVAADEIRVLSSRSLLEPIVQRLKLTTTCEKRCGLKWKNVYPEYPIDVILTKPLLKPCTFKVYMQKGEYTLRGANKLIQNNGLQIQMQEGLQDGVYRVTLKPLMVAVDDYQKKIKVSRLNRESNIIEISMVSNCPSLAIDLINMMLDNYNQQTAMDKNLLAVQTDQFLSNRLDVITNELNQSENVMENYKREHHITNLDAMADFYRQTCEQYDRELIDIDEQIRKLDYTTSEINKEENCRKVFPFFDGNISPVLVSLISEYNASIVRINTLLRTVDEAHPMVQQEAELLNHKRQNLFANIAQSRHTLEQRRADVVSQKATYQSRLEGVPEQDRIYRELKRNKTTKENQYMYLIERREENAMLMASAAIPAITIDRAQMNPNKVAPKVSILGIVAILLGFLVPMFYFLLSFCYIRPKAEEISLT